MPCELRQQVPQHCFNGVRNSALDQHTERFRTAVWLASAAWPHPMSFPMTGGDRSGQSCSCSIDCPILEPDLQIFRMSAFARER